MIDDNDIAQAFDRIARTPDGETIYRHFQKRLMGTLADHAPEDSALRTEHGMRRFAAELMAMMARGIDESDGRNSSPGDRATERVVVFRTRPRTGGNQHVSAREHLARHDPEYQRIAGLTVNDGGET